MTGAERRAQGTPGTPIPDPPGLRREGERCRLGHTDGSAVPCVMTWSQRGAPHGTQKQTWEPRRLGTVPKHSAEPAPTAEDAQEGRVGNSFHHTDQSRFPNSFPQLVLLGSWLSSPAEPRASTGHPHLTLTHASTLPRDKSGRKEKIKSLWESIPLSLHLYFNKNLTININVQILTKLSLITCEPHPRRRGLSRQ